MLRTRALGGSIRPVNAPPHQKWSTAAFGLAALCLAGLALSSVLGMATATVSLVLLGGILVSGTLAWTLQARHKCPHCGHRYGYGLRIVRANSCRRCGGDTRG